MSGHSVISYLSPNGLAFKIPIEITPQEVAARLKKGEFLMMVDVREVEEWTDGH
jgi:hypothetical protein